MFPPLAFWASVAVLSTANFVVRSEPWEIPTYQQQLNRFQIFSGATRVHCHLCAARFQLAISVRFFTPGAVNIVQLAHSCSEGLLARREGIRLKGYPFR
jgi:hypothetical protein